MRFRLFVVLSGGRVGSHDLLQGRVQECGLCHEHVSQAGSDVSLIVPAQEPPLAHRVGKKFRETPSRVSFWDNIEPLLFPKILVDLTDEFLVLGPLFRGVRLPRHLQDLVDLPRLVCSLDESRSRTRDSLGIAPLFDD